MTCGTPGTPDYVDFRPFEWKTRLDSTKILLKHELVRVRVDLHPLQRFSSQTDHATAGQSDGIKDPLGSLLDGNDPLSLLQKQAINQLFDELSDDSEATDVKLVHQLIHNGAGTSSSKPRPPKAKLPRTFKSRAIKRNINCEDYNTDATIDIHRLKLEISEHLAFDGEFLRKFRRLKPSELVMEMENFHEDMVRAWKKEERVEALKIVIVCAKLSMDTENPILYPLKYVCLSDILSKFGEQVYERLKIKEEIFISSLTSPKDPRKPASTKPPGTAQETCLNWFYKIASVRELVPRLYAEAALLRSYSFLEDGRMITELKKLTKLTRAVGDLIVNLYLRCYLCQMGMECEINLVLYNYFRENFDEFMITLNSFLSRDDFDDKINLNRYLETLLPGLEWLLKGITDRDPHVQDMLLRLFRNMPNNSIMLLTALKGFTEDFIVLNIDNLLEWLLSPELAEVPKYKHLMSLGKMCENIQTKSADCIPDKVLKTVWDETERLTDTSEYLNVVELWLPLSQNCLPTERVNSILQIFGPHVAREQSVERHSTRVENVVRNLTRYADDFHLLFISEHFIPFLNTIPNIQLRVTVCKIIMEALVQRSDCTFICDSVTLNSVMIVARTVHDSIRMSTVDDERKQIGNLLANFVRHVRFRDDFVRQMEFYSQARMIFYQLDIVLETLVHCINWLCFEQLKSVKGNHDPASLEFAQSCVAYNFITIPTLESPVTRLQLLIISGQVALANQCLDMEAINTMKKFNDIRIDATSTDRIRADFTFERTAHKEIIFKSYALQMMSILIVMPDDPDGKSVFRLCSRLYRAINSFEWKDPMMQPSLVIMLMRMYSAGYQEVYPYHFLNVDSNDTLYGPDELFRQKMDTAINVLMHDAIRSIIQLRLNNHYASLMLIVEELLAIIFAFGDLTNKSLAVLSIQLWDFCKQIPFNTKVLMTVQYLQDEIDTLARAVESRAGCHSAVPNFIII
ncbi:hypothetical protein V9T40_007824 [Parthenolecanium corni]|uniref:Uncharacterized protein n=1 Tax=Parthenolecanium corni TaxID=536013 RepID=A0AAN9TK34_9HEMI